MTRVLLIITALLTLPFGIVALMAPETLFAQFGVDLTAAGALVARGYAATLVAYGLLLFLMRNTTDRATVTALLLSMAVFNLIEMVIQGVAAGNGIVNSKIWGTVVAHAAVFSLCVVAFLRRKTSVGATSSA